MWVTSSYDNRLNTRVAMTSEIPAGPAKALSLINDVQPPELILDDGIYLIGRESSCDIVVVGDKSVSRRHAEIQVVNRRCLLRDLNSTNGTFVNNRQIKRQWLKDEDIIGIARRKQILRLSDPYKTEAITHHIEYDDKLMTFYLNDTPLDLSPKELRLFTYLYNHAGEVCSRRDCAEATWQRTYDPGPDDENLDRTMTNIRRKLRKIEADSHYVETRKGVGYVLHVTYSQPPPGEPPPLPVST